MFTQKWREHWGLMDDPFNSEDADKDSILSALDSSVVHWSFDRMYGNPRMAAPAIVFGEKGSGKSGLRLMIRRRLLDWNEKHPDEKVFLIEYIDFNPYLARFRRVIGARADDRQAAQDVVKRWKISDHLDSILSLGVTKFIDGILASGTPPQSLTRKQKMYLLLLTTLYYNSDRKSTGEALHSLNRLIRYRSFLPTLRWGVTIGMTLLSFLLLLFPYLSSMAIGPNQLWFTLGGLGLLGTWGWWLYHYFSIHTQSSWAARSVKILARNPANLALLLSKVSAKERKEYILPRGSEEATRYHLLDRFMDLLETAGYQGVYVLMDRVDEPSLLSVSEDLMRQFVERLLDIKLLQYPRLGLKLFLPIEMDIIHRNAAPEQLKHMRLDKSNLIEQLKWSGQELYEIASQRLRVCQSPEAPPIQLSDLFEDGFDFACLRDTLTTLGTPRYAFGFLSTLITDYVKELPNDLPDSDPRWKITRSQFEVARALWVDRSGVLRRILN
ncbi:MAG TPA: hypothetical protein PLH79_16340 [bacterium]|nr:hypothetical protein [Candidatus Omnitrophota bacterium]HOL95919.1 hypothetical protein [bacterium]HXK93969.1 hypothetical protein [bacterium]